MCECRWRVSIGWSRELACQCGCIRSSSPFSTLTTSPLHNCAKKWWTKSSKQSFRRSTSTRRLSSTSSPLEDLSSAVHRWLLVKHLYALWSWILLSCPHSWNETETKLKQNSFKKFSKYFHPEQPWNVLAVLNNHSPYPLFTQNCCLWCCQANYSKQTWRLYALLVSVKSN